MFISFAKPQYLFLLLLIPLLIVIHFISLKKHKKKALKFANFEALQRIKGIEFFSKNLVVLYVSVFIVLLVVLSVSGATWHMTVRASSFSFVLTIDASQSMETTDVNPSRIDAAKLAAKDFVDFAPINTKIGIISFTSVPYIHKELTDDRYVLKSAIDEIYIKPVGGTNMLDAVIAGLNMLRKEDARAIILISDGQINIESVESLIDYANENDVIVHTIGVGTTAGKETSIGYISKMDEDALKSIAYDTNGRFFLASDRIKLSNSFKEIIGYTKKKVSIDLSGWLAAAAIVIFVGLYVLSNLKYRSFP